LASPWQTGHVRGALKKKVLASSIKTFASRGEHILFDQRPSTIVWEGPVSATRLSLGRDTPSLHLIMQDEQNAFTQATRLTESPSARGLSSITSRSTTVRCCGIFLCPFYRTICVPIRPIYRQLWADETSRETSSSGNSPFSGARPARAADFGFFAGQRENFVRCRSSLRGNERRFRTMRLRCARKQPQVM